MRNVTLLAITCFALASCDTKFFPVTGKYPTDATAIIKSSAKSKDEIWSRIMKFVAENDISIKTIDKSAGFIRSDRMDFKRYAWAEPNKYETMSSKGKYLVTERIRDHYGDTLRFPNYITASMKIFVIEEHDSIMLRINIEEPVSSDVYIAKANSVNYYYITSCRDVRSLGKLENEIGAYLLTGKDMPRLILPKIYTR